MIIILLVLFLVCVGVSILALVDAASTTAGAFVDAGMSKTMWVTLIAVFILVFAPVGFVLALFYLISVRPKVRKLV
jgi:hypothetical protein